MIEKNKNIILEITFDFSILIVEYCEILENQRKYVIANQLLRSGTSIGANVREAQNSESRADFIHKMKIALKEVEEAQYWLELCKFSKSYPDTDLLIEKIKSIKNVLSKIVITSKLNKNLNQ